MKFSSQVALSVAITSLASVSAAPVAQRAEQVQAECLSRREPLNAIAMWGLTGGAVLKGIFGGGNKEAAEFFASKEGQDFLASEDGQAFVSKLAEDDPALQSRGVPVDLGKYAWKSWAAPLVAAVTATAAGIYASHSKEAQDFLNSDEGRELISKMAEDESLAENVNEKRLSAAGLSAAIFVATTAYNGLKSNGFIKEAEELQRQYGGLLGDDAADSTIQARGKVDYGWLMAGIISGFNTIRARDMENSVDDFDLLG